MSTPQPWNGTTKIPLGQLLVSTSGYYYWVIFNEFDHPQPRIYHLVDCISLAAKALTVTQIRECFLICPVCKPVCERKPVVGEKWAPVVPWLNEILTIDRVPVVGDIAATVIDTTDNEDRTFLSPVLYFHPTYFLTFYRPFEEAKEMHFGT